MPRAVLDRGMPYNGFVRQTIMVRERVFTPAMDKEEALSLLKDFLDRLEGSGHDALSARVGENSALEITGPSGRKYQIEYDILWDHRLPNGDIRLIGSVDDGGLRAFIPLTDSRRVSPPSH